MRTVYTVHTLGKKKEAKEIHTGAGNNVYITKC